MTNTLDEMCREMRDGLVALRNLKARYPNSRAFLNFLNRKERDYEEFLKLVSRLPKNTFAPAVVDYLREIKADRKFFGMTQRTKDYFKVTKKLLNEIAAEN